MGSFSVQLTALAGLVDELEAAKSRVEGLDDDARGHGDAVGSPDVAAALGDPSDTDFTSSQDSRPLAPGGPAAGIEVRNSFNDERPVTVGLTFNWD